MQKSGLTTIIFGLLIVVGLVVSVVENQMMIGGISQENGRVSMTESVTVSAEIDRLESPIGIFAVQVMESETDSVSVTVMNPSSIEIINEIIDEDILEQEFDIYESGTYQMMIASSDDEGVYVTGVIGPLPDAGKRMIVALASLAILIVGMAGLVITGIYGIRKKRSV